MKRLTLIVFLILFAITIVKTTDCPDKHWFDDVT